VGARHVLGCNWFGGRERFTNRGMRYRCSYDKALEELGWLPLRIENSDAYQWRLQWHANLRIPTSWRIRR
jgi:hypothetical protein